MSLDPHSNTEKPYLVKYNHIIRFLLHSLQVPAIPATRTRPTLRQAQRLQTIPPPRATPPSDRRRPRLTVLPRPPQPDRSPLLRPRRRRRKRRSLWSRATRSRRRARSLRRKRRRRRQRILSETTLNAPTSRTLPHPTHPRAHFKHNPIPQERMDSMDTSMVSRDKSVLNVGEIHLLFQVLDLICAPAS